MWYILYTAWPYDEAIEAAVGPFIDEASAEMYMEGYDYHMGTVENESEICLEDLMVDEPEEY